MIRRAKKKSCNMNENLKLSIARGGAGIAVLFVLIMTMSFAVTPVIAQPVKVWVNAPESVEESEYFCRYYEYNGCNGPQLSAVRPVF